MTASKFAFGDIVLLAFPFTDSVQKKKRPALILQDTNDGDVVLCRITSQEYETTYDFIIEEWGKFGLLLPSVVRLHKLATLDKKLIEKKLGKLDAKTKREFKNFTQKTLVRLLK